MRVRLGGALDDEEPKATRRRVHWLRREGLKAEQVRTVGAFPAEVLSALYASSDLFSDYTR